MKIPLAILIMHVLLSLARADKEATATPVTPPKAEINENVPAKVREIVRKMATITKGMSRRDVIEHLGLDKDGSVKDLDGGGNLGEGYESYDLGINDEWILTIDYKFGFKDGQWDFNIQEVFEVSLQRGSITKYKNDEDQDWDLYYPFWRKGTMIAEAPKKQDTVQGGADQPAAAPELKSEGKYKPQPEKEVAPR